MKTSNLLMHWGPFVVDSDGQHVVAVSGHPQDPDPSPIGASLKQSQQCRVARPAVRRSWLEHGPGSSPELRGVEPFVEVDWDEALDLVAAELTRVRDAYGHQAIFGGSYGWGSAGRFHMPSNQIFRFLRQFGGCTDVWGTYSSTAVEGIIPYIFGMPYFAAQGQQTSWSVVAEHTELFVSFGGVRISNAQVSYTGQGPHRTRDWMQRCRAQGVTFLNISPLRDDIEAQFEPRWIHPYPGTDTALMAALIHTLIVEDKYDKDFVQRYCHGWPTLSAYLCGDSDGLAKSADWAAGITGLNSAEIRSLAHEMASKRTFINLTYALQRQDHGEQPYWMAVALAAALGQIGLPGGGFAFPFGSAGSPGNGQPPKRIPSLPVPKRPADMPVISVSRIVDLLEAKAGERFECNGRNGAYPDTHMVYWAGGNIFHHHQDLNRLNRAWQRPETIVVHEPFWTSMAKRADIVLPATTPLERNDLGAAETMLLSMQAVLEPFGQARDDYAIFAELAKRLDFGATFTENRDADEWVEHLYEQFRTSNNFAPPYEEFRELGTLHHDMPPMGTPTQVFLSEFRADPQGKPLGTPSGLIELVSETIGAYGYADCPAHPSWLEPYERLGTDAALKHPLHLVSNQPIGRLHSQYDHGEASQQQKHKGREVCRLNPSEAAARGLQEADVVRIYNDRGACLAAVHITDAVMPGAIQLATGAWYDPDDKGMCKHGNPNVLTRDKGTSQLAQGPTAHTCLVEVERLDGEPPAITAFDPPAIVARNS